MIRAEINLMRYSNQIYEPAGLPTIIYCIDQLISFSSTVFNERR